MIRRRVAIGGPHYGAKIPVEQPPGPISAPPPAWVRVLEDGIIVETTVVPGARRSALADVSGNRLRIRIAAPPVEGRANEELRSFLASITRRRRSQVTVLTGTTSRAKSVHVKGDPSEVLGALTDAARRALPPNG